MSTPKLVSTDELAEMLSTTASTLRSWRSLGQGPKWIKLSKGVLRYRLSDVEQ